MAAEKVYEAIAGRIEAAEGTVRIGVSAQDNVSESVTLRGLGFIDKMAELVGGVKLEGDTFYCEQCPTCGSDDNAKVIIETLVPCAGHFRAVPDRLQHPAVQGRHHRHLRLQPALRRGDHFRQ